MNFEEIYKKCKGYTVTSYERMKSLYEVVVLVNDKNLDGDYVECGVYMGGSIMNMAYTQLNYAKKVHIHLYDTFEHMTPPTEVDKDYKGISAFELLKNEQYMCIYSLRQVVLNMKKTGYPENFLHYHKGDVAKTLLEDVPEKVSVLRMDTDWYESTKIELEVLYPKIVSGGFLIIDDYGHFVGCKKATDDYFKKIGVDPLFKQIDYTGVLHVKGSRV